MIAGSVTELIGNTPLLELKKYAAKYSLKARILAKLEYLNPAGSVKDRTAVSMIDAAEADGRLKKGGCIVEPTSGNTGIGLACVAAARGYRVVLTMPDSMSEERRTLLRAYGAEIVLTEGEKGMKGAIERAEQIARELDGFVPDQFSNPANPAAHYRTTGPEIWRDTDGGVDVFIAGVGTGGTVSGTGRYLKERNSAVRVVGVEPASSPILTKGYGGTHGIQGIGAGFVPQALDLSVVDEILSVGDQEAFSAGKEIAAEEGILVGISSGAALHAARLLAGRRQYFGKTIVVLLPDSGDRYLSTALFRSGSF